MKVKSNQEILEFLKPYADSVGVTIEDIEFKKGQNPSLTIYIDREGGVDLDTCEKFHMAIFDPLDVLDPTFDMPYTLNVSSLGVDRPFKKDEDYIKHIGTRVEVKLYSSIRGKKYYDGILLSYENGQVVLQVDNKTQFTIELKNVVKMNEYIDF